MLAGRGHHLRPIYAAAGVVLAIYISWPYSPAENLASAFSQRAFDDAASDVRTLIGHLSSIAPLAAASLAAAILMNRAHVPHWDVGLRLMLFASVLVGTGPAWGVVPGPLLLAVGLFVPVVLVSSRRASLLNRFRPQILADRRELLRLAYEHARSLAGPDGFFALKKPKGDAEGPPEKSGPLMVTMPDGTRMQAAEVAFALGPTGQARRDALLALRVGLWGALAFAALYGAPAFIQPREYDPFPSLWATIRVLSVAGYWLLGAFFLGYFYEGIRGRAGWEKGAWLALGISLAEAPFAILNASSGPDFAAAAIAVAQRFAFFIIVGLLAFDQKLFRSAIGHAVEWRMFPRVSGLSVVGAFSSALAASVGVAVSSAVSGQLTTVLALVAQTLLPVSPPAPPATTQSPQQESTRS